MEISSLARMQMLMLRKTLLRKRMKPRKRKKMQMRTFRKKILKMSSWLYHVL